ncbi:MAG: hypothetical protein IJV77_03440 [Clostridia bacterium]|nr:hypothetical protein [Clostridia bacterium]
MAKFKKFFSIIALAVFSLTFLVGCGLFVLNEDRYRDQVALTVGQETVTLGEVIDYFDTNGLAYIQQGYTYQQVWDMMFPVFVPQKVMLNEYKTKFSGTKNTGTLATEIGGDAQYLTDSELEYIQKSVYSSFYARLDSLTMSELNADFTFDEEKADNEYPEMITYGSDYSPADADKKLDVEKLDEQLAEYVANQDFKSVKYVFEQNDAKLAEIVADLNERLVKDNDDDADVSAEDYIKAQNKAVSTVTKNIKNSKKLTLEEYLAQTIETQIESRIAENYLTDIYADNQTEITEEVFNARLAAKIAQVTDQYAQNPSSFASFITGLTDDDFVYCVPQQYEGQYYYVRSILLPFSDEQTDRLNLAKTRFGANSAQYKDYRKTMADEITVTDNQGNEGITPAQVRAEIDTSDRDSFIQATYKYNTDPGMQNPVHAYVVSKDPTDLGFAGTNFVKEFVDASRFAINHGQKMTYCVTDYGVHLIWVDGEVVADNITYAQRNNYGVEGGSASWRFHQDIYQELKELFTDEQVAALYNTYKTEGKIVINGDVISGYTDTIDVEFKN